jgi:hypothetical protein
VSGANPAGGGCSFPLTSNPSPTGAMGGHVTAPAPSIALAPLSPRG